MDPALYDNASNKETGPDPCLGKLPGVLAACCGHGRKDGGYIWFENGVLLEFTMKSQPKTHDTSHAAYGLRDPAKIKHNQEAGIAPRRA